MTTFPMACCRWNHSKLTDDTGCVSFEELQWVTGSIGPALVLFEAEGNSTYQLTMLVNADQPQPAELGFIYEQGLYDNFWYAVSPRAAEQCLSHSRARVGLVLSSLQDLVLGPAYVVDVLPQQTL